MRSALAQAVPLLVAAAACGPADVVVSIEIDVDDPAGGGTIRRSLSDVEVQLLPFDRDAVLDSIVGAFPTPEPEIPAELLTARMGVRAAQAERDLARFDSLHPGVMHASDSVRALRERWRDGAFADVESTFADKVDASGLRSATDTTDASGVARANLKVKPGRYWVHARYGLPDTELYWNVPVTVERGEPVQVHLTRLNAEERLRP